MLDNEMKIKGKQIQFRLWLLHHVQNIEHTIFPASSPSNEYFMRHLPNTVSAQNIIVQGLTKKKDFLLLRFGLYEYQLCFQFLEKENGLRSSYSQDLLYHLPLDTGLFGPTTETYDRYARKIISSLDGVDVLSYWRNIPSYFLFSPFYGPKVAHINVEDLYPYPFWHSKVLPTWQGWLRGKRVLVVSSFADTIKKQYAHRKEIWPIETILPEFTLIPYQAVQTNGGRDTKNFLSWEDALHDMVDNISQQNFDLALISCGGYGMPLAIELHAMGKRAIQWGGCSQLWFGIMGGRWNQDANIMRYFNPSWTYPSEDETPPLSNLVSGCSYWNPQK